MPCRYIEESDLRSLLDAERAANETSYEDPDFGGVLWLNPWTMSADDVMAVIRQRQSSDKCTFDTRTYVLEGERNSRPWVAGGFSYEKQEDSYEVIFVTLHPEAPFEKLAREFLSHMKNLARRAQKRRRARLYVRDREEAGVRKWLSLARAEGFSVSLARDHFGNHDGWRCDFYADNEKAA